MISKPKIPYLYDSHMEFNTESTTFYKISVRYNVSSFNKDLYEYCIISSHLFSGLFSRTTWLSHSRS